MQCRYYTARKKSPEFSLIELVFADFRFTEPHEKFLKTMDDAGLRRKRKDYLELGIIIMVQEGISLADCTNINGGACHMRTKCTFFSNAAEPTL